MIAALVPALAGMIGTLIDKAIPDKGEAERLKADLTRQLLTMQADELKQASSIILAEVQGGSWLQRTWRPLLMLWFAGLVGAYWFGFTPENLSPAAIDNLFQLVQIGVGGYVVGRSAEKVAKEIKRND